MHLTSIRYIVGTSHMQIKALTAACWLQVLPIAAFGVGSTIKNN